MISAGRLNTLLKLQQPATGQDAAGQPATGWVELGELWGDVRHASGLQTIKADADTSIVKVSIRIRYRSGITAAMRLVEKGSGVVYDIKSPLPDGRREFMDVVCEVVV